jgi:copper chaperone
MKKTLKVKGMHCKSCEMLITDALDDIGVQAKVNVKTGDVIVDYDESKTSLADIKKVLKEEGYTA